MKKTGLSAIIMAAFLAVTAVPAAAAESDTITVTIENNDVSWENDGFIAKYDETITVDGVEYSVCGEPEYTYDETCERKTIEKRSGFQFEEIYTDRDGNSVETKRVKPETDEFPETLTEDGVTYTRQGEPKAEEEPLKGRKAVSTVTIHRNKSRDGQAKEETKAGLYTDPDSGTVKMNTDDNVTIKKKDSTQTAEYWDNGAFSGKFTITGYEYESFEYQGVELPVREDVPLAPEYYYLIMQEQGLDAADYQLTDVSWSGEPYTDGVTHYRDAVITGNIYNREYDDLFEGEISIPDITRVCYVATYVETDESYIKRSGVNAEIKYEKVEEETETEAESDTESKSETETVKEPIENTTGSTKTPVFITVGIALTVIIAIVILTAILLMKKRKKEE